MGDRRQYDPALRHVFSSHEKTACGLSDAVVLHAIPVLVGCGAAADGFVQLGGFERSGQGKSRTGAQLRRRVGMERYKWAMCIFFFFFDIFPFYLQILYVYINI